MNRKKNLYKIPIYVFFSCISIFLFIVPMVIVISASLSGEHTLAANLNNTEGFGILPKDFTLDAYRKAFANPHTITQGYFITASQAFLGTFLSCFVCGMIAYSLSRSNFAFRKIITFIVFFTMLFGGGMIPTYIVYTRYYHLGDNFLVYILPGITGGAWNTLMIRTFFKSLPESLFESAKLDGASEMTIFMKIAVPLSKPVFATVAFMTLVSKWGDWNTSLLYIRNSELYTLQYILQKVLNEAEFLKSMANNPIMGVNLDLTKQPAETLKFALCVIAAGPMLVIFPFFQKYFAKGLTVGAVKG